MIKKTFRPRSSLWIVLGCLLAGQVLAYQTIPLPLRFARGSTEIDEPDMVFIKSAARRLQQQGMPKLVLVESFARDKTRRKPASYEDQRLSQVRAERISSLLQAMSEVPAERFKSVGHGAENRSTSAATAREASDIHWITVKVFRDSDPIDGDVSIADKSLLQCRELFSTSLRDAHLGEVFEMLSRQARLNIILSEGVGGQVSVNLYDVNAEQALFAIADAAGFAVERRNGSYVVLKREDAGRYATGGITQIRVFKVRYLDPKLITETVGKHLSRYGKITTLPGRKQLIVEDTPEFLTLIEKLLGDIDTPPTQFMIEAKILEITLNKTETYGVDWAKLSNFQGSKVSIGTPGLPELTPGLELPSELVNPFGGALVFSLLNPKLRVFLKALSDEGRVRTLSTPKLLALEDQEADVLIGDRIGYRTTTTINQVTTESVEFLDSGVKLNVIPSLVGNDTILLKVHPEVSAGTLSGGVDQLPLQKTTEVTTQLLAKDGETVFIGGIIKNETAHGRTGIPFLGKLPLLGTLFSSTDDRSLKTETVVLITPYIAQRAADDQHGRKHR